MRISSHPTAAATVAVIFLAIVASLSTVASFSPISLPSASSHSARPIRQSSTAIRSDWGDFAYIDDDDDDLLGDSSSSSSSSGADSMSAVDFAGEDDTQERKAEVGSSLEPPDVDWFGDPIEVPLGTALPLEVETVQGLLAACRGEIGTMFGYSAENRGVGITGGVDFVDLDGPIVVLRLKGRFWHQRTTVLDRVAAYLQGRCPEIVDVVVEDEWQLTDEANNEAA